MCKAHYAATVKPISPNRLARSLLTITSIVLLNRLYERLVRCLAPPALVCALQCGVMRSIMLLTLDVREEWYMARRTREDPKVAALVARRSLNPHPERVADEGFLASSFFDARDLLQVKYEMVRRVEVEGVSVKQAAAEFGFSRPSYYAAAQALETGGLAGLLAERPGPKRAHKLSAEVVAFVLEQLASGAASRPRELTSAIEARFGIRVHERSIERAVMRARAPKSGAR